MSSAIDATYPKAAEAVNTQDDNLRANFSAAKTEIEDLQEGDPAGRIATFARPTPPQGWLECDGSAVSRTTYARLFAAIGTYWGVGNGSTTFNLPDLRGEFIRCWDHGRGVDPDRAFASAQADAIKSHHHLMTVRRDAGAPFEMPGYSGGKGATYSADNTGDTGGTETRPRNIALLACIRY